MRIAVTAKGPGLDDQVDPRFGRCPFFVLINPETMEIEAVENPNLTLGGGAGIQSAQLMAERDVTALLTGNCGPNAYQTLSAAGIDVIVGVSGLVRDAVAQYKAGSFPVTQGPNVASHFGVGAPPTPDSGTGRGMGGGMGGGGGMGRGMGRGRGMGTIDGPPTSASPPSRRDEVGMLKSEAQRLEAELKAITERIAHVADRAPASRLVAAVNSERCTACGACIAACPTDAITVEEIAVISSERCTGCGECLPQCPQEALTLRCR